IERGFAESDVVVESEYSVPITSPVPVETHRVLTYIDENDCLVVRTATGTPHLVRRTLAMILDLPFNHIRVVRPNVGGDFGTKQGIVLEDLCALLTLSTHRPVQLIYSSEDEFRAGRVQQRHIIRMKTGVKRDGTMLAQQMLVLASTGAYATHPMLRANPPSPLSLYVCPNKRFAIDVLYTNTPSSITTYAPEPELFALECHMNEVAQRLGVDALALRRKNWRGVDSSGTQGQNGQHQSENGDNGGNGDSLNAYNQAIEVKSRERGDVKATNSKSVRRGTGLAFARYDDNAHEVSGATIMLNEGGTFDMFVAVADDTSKTLLAQIAAETLGVSVDSITLHTMDTSIIPFSAATDASQLLVSAGNAVREAATRVRQTLLTYVSESGLLKAQANNLSIEDGMIVVREQGDQKLMLQQASEHIIIVQGKQVIASATGKGEQQSSFAVHKAEVEVDTAMGIVRVLRVISAVDGGRILNPLLAEGQVQGAISRAVNRAMSEEMVYDKQGQPLIVDVSSCHLYHASDMPDIQVVLIESSGAKGPFGAKSVVEVAELGVASAITNAVANALGVQIRQLPLTPERVLRTIYASEARQ
ncbi:MAG TPA: hypothetical protein DHW02_16190, partial [Ktedonobacter sp.]|nr:hypothetical protein [Ktedonobacter sp.]